MANASNCTVAIYEYIGSTQSVRQVIETWACSAYIINRPSSGIRNFAFPERMFLFLLSMWGSTRYEPRSLHSVSESKTWRDLSAAELQSFLIIK